MNLSNNGIESFASQTFIGASRVEYFYLRNNKINAFTDKMPLKYMTSLKVLDLTSAFDTTTSSRRRSDLLKLLFDSDHDFVDLSEIILASNKLEHIHSDTFCKVNFFKSISKFDSLGQRTQSLDFERQSSHIAGFRWQLFGSSQLIGYAQQSRILRPIEFLETTSNVEQSRLQSQSIALWLQSSRLPWICTRLQHIVSFTTRNDMCIAEQSSRQEFVRFGGQFLPRTWQLFALVCFAVCWRSNPIHLSMDAQKWPHNKNSKLCGRLHSA